MDNTEKQLKDVINLFTEKLKYESDIVEVNRLQGLIKDLEIQLNSLDIKAESSNTHLDYLTEHTKSRI